MIFIHPLTIIYIILGLITNRLNGVIFLYLFGFLHEICHVFVASLFKIKTKSITFLPMGFYANLEDIDELSLFKQIIILLAGPLSYFLCPIILQILLKSNIISSYGFDLGMDSALMILLFNLLPIFPLDGGKIIDIILARFFNEYVCRVLRIAISIFVCLVMLLMIKSLGDYVMLAIIILSIISSIIHLKKDYFRFLFKRKFIENKYEDKIVDKLEIYRFKNNILIKDKKIYFEDQVIDLIINENKK